MALSININRARRSGFVAGILTAVFAIALQPLAMNIPAAFATITPPSLDTFPSTNEQNKTNGNQYVEKLAATPTKVTLRFVNPTSSAQYFEVRKDDAASTSTSKWGPCRIGVDPLPAVCAGLRYLAEDDYSYPSVMVAPGQSRVISYEVADNLAIRVTFGPERNWDFDWTVFEVASVPVVQTITVDKDNMEGWVAGDMRAGGEFDFVPDSTSPLPAGVLQLRTTSSVDDKAQLMKGSEFTLTELYKLSYAAKQNSANVASGNASLQLPVFLEGNTGFTTLVYEPYWNGTVVPGQWQQWDARAGKFWSSRSYGSVQAGSGGPPFYTVEEVLEMYPNAKVLGYGINVGTYNPDYNINVDEFTVANSTINHRYDFEYIAPDTTAPTTSNLQFSPYINDNSGRLLTVRIDITDPSGVRDDSYVRFQHDGKERTYRFANIGGDTYEAIVDTRDLVPVNRFAEVSSVFRFCDELGNCRSSKPQPYRTIGFDNSGPSSRLLSPLSPNNVVSGDVKLELGFTDDTGVQSARLKLDGPVERWYNVPTVTDTTGEITIDTTALPDGEYSVGIRPVDVFGNPRMGKDKGTIVIDNTAPAQVQGLTISQNANVVGCGGAVNERRITVSWDASSDANLKHYEYQADREAAAPYEFTTTTSGTSRTGDIRDEDGTYNYRVRAIDQAGSQGDWSDWCSVTLDRTAPLVTIIQPDKNTLLVPGPITVQGTIDDLNVTTVSVELNGVTQSAPVQNTGTWQTTFSNVPFGIFNILATAEDAAGNRSESSMDMTVTNVPPQIISVPPAPTGDSGAPENQNGEVLGVSTDGSNGNSASGNTLTPFTGLLPGAALFAQTGIGPQGESVGLNSPDSDGDEDVEVLGEDSDQSTEGTLEEDVVVEDDCASLLGLCWYWWFPIGLAAFAVVYVLVRMAGEDDGQPQARNR